MQFILSTFERQLVKRENSFIEAVSYSLVYYEADLEYELEERILIPLLLGKIVTERTNRFFLGQYKLFEKVAKEVQERQNELDLTREELIEVVDCANYLLQLLPKMEITNDPQEK
ncbi:MAG: hypothetical protein GX270_12435 [Clostridiaceae bacterium]|nr:hypothetical protein [Clostridiaceae bacterium]